MLLATVILEPGGTGGGVYVTFKFQSNEYSILYVVLSANTDIV